MDAEVAIMGMDEEVVEGAGVDQSCDAAVHC